MAYPDVRVVRMRPAFLSKRESASQQRGLFAGPLPPNRLAVPAFVPAVPDLPGLLASCPAPGDSPRGA